MLARMDEWQPDVVLLGLTPRHAVSQIQAIKARSPAPLIGLVPEENTQATIEALDAGVDDCITKPFGVVARHLASKRRHYGSTLYTAMSIAAVARLRCRGVSSSC